MTENKKDIKFEIRCRKLLLKKLETLERRLKQAVNKEAEKRNQRYNSLRDYKTPEEVADAYGYGDIARDEYERLMDSFKNEEMEAAATVTPNSAALEMLAEFTGRLKRDIQYFEFELLPENERERILKEQEDLLKRKGGRTGDCKL